MSSTEKTARIAGSLGEDDSDPLDERISLISAGKEV